MSPGRSFFVTSSASGRSGLFEPKSTITGMLAIVPASTARSTGAHSGPLKCAVLTPTINPGYLLRHVGGRLRLHVVEILLVLPAAHAVADDVEEGEDAGLRRDR